MESLPYERTLSKFNEPAPTKKCVGVVLKRFLSVNTKYGIANLRHLVMELDSPIPSLAISS